jgi:antitoxin component YwqK of YwqJK toxin-antitoxin module
LIRREQARTWFALATAEHVQDALVQRFLRYSRYPSVDGSFWIRHGLFRAYHEDGSLASEGAYENGHEHRIWRDYYPNGQLAAEGNYVNGAQAGTWQYWSPDGSRESSGEA